MPADLFIGLVTHPRTRFPEASTADGLAARMAARAAEHGWVVESVVIDQDLLTEDHLRVDRGEVMASIRAELDVEARWRQYVSGRRLWPRERGAMRARRQYRTVRLAPPWQPTLSPDSPGSKMVRRLANIELAHLTTLDAAVASGARWSVILEDDARSDDAEHFTAELMQFIDAADQSGEPAMMNLSESFSIDQLGIRHLLTPRTNPGQPPTWNTWCASRAVTNTVCAVLYRRDFLTQLVQRLHHIPLSPVVPIDFKVNAALMSMLQDAVPIHLSAQPGRELAKTNDICWVISPAPLQQASGVPNVPSAKG